ncbi:glycosyltransferase family 87 protein [Sphingomonas hankyongi]|uniref:DUF2029 domain-containing protein n=1 Tax=Sphingomonas hankyongi TaxID=2908209 RepID=A0ABT0RYG3_9SPHN|nr:DUF2029 domain-containing protein [Sphingomonas hankyongi]
MEILATGSWVTRDRVRAFATISALVGAGMLLFLWLARNGTVDWFGTPVGSDFTAFWHGGRLANEGDAVRVWDLAALNAAVEATHGVVFPTAWIYPPVVLLVFTPIASLPYLPALFVWQVLSVAAIGLILRAILPDDRALLVALASPLTATVLAGGQNAFMTAALLGAGLVWLERRPALGGGFFGALLYKPQLALMIAPLILFTRSWRALLGGVCTALALIVASLLLWGPESWLAFINSLSLGQADIMEKGVTGFFKSASLFAAARQWGIPVNLAYVIQGLGALAGIWGVWQIRNAKPSVRAAVVCAGAALSTPYLFDYDMAVVGVGAAFLYADASRDGFLSYEKSALAFIWAVPWVARSAAQLLALPLSPVTMILLFWLAIRRARSGHGHPTVDVDGLPGDVTGFPAR